MYLILFVLNDPEKLDDLLDAWEAAGAPGATILYSSGLGRVRLGGGYRDDLPLIPSLDDFIQHEEALSRTIFAIVDAEALVDRIVAATEQVVGDLSLAHTGVMAVLPVARTYGLVKQHNARNQNEC